MQLNREETAALIGLVTEYVAEASRADSPLAREFVVVSNPAEYRADMYQLLHILIAGQAHAEPF